MTTISVEEAQSKLSELIDQLTPGEELLLTRNNQTVARIVGETVKPRQRREPGLCKGMLTIVSDDDDYLADFAEYIS